MGVQPQLIASVQVSSGALSQPTTSARRPTVARSSIMVLEAQKTPTEQPTLQSTSVLYECRAIRNAAAAAAATPSSDPVGRPRTAALRARRLAAKRATVNSTTYVLLVTVTLIFLRVDY